MRESNRLTALKIGKLKRPGLYADGNGLCLQVQPGPTKAWIFRYMLARRPRKMGLGPLALVPLAEAREKALAYRRLLLAGIDPLEARAVERANAAAEALRIITFSQCADKYIAAHRTGWKNAKHAAQWESTIATYAKPIIGPLPVQAIDTAAVMKVLEQDIVDKAKGPTPLWRALPDTAGRLRGRIELILGWATVRGYRTGDNPARWRGHIDQLLPGRSKIAKVRHHAALPYRELPAFMTALRGRAGISARALEFTILTATRTGEVIGARRKEFDPAERMWGIPAARMKGRDDERGPHRIPLSERALEILAELPSEGEFVFPGRQPGTALSNMAMLETLKQMGRGDLTTHGFRSTFRDWSAETTAYPHELLEMALAHAVGDKVEAAYRRGDLLEKRRRLMADWAAYCASRPVYAVNVVSLRSGEVVS
jgi:integrase